MIDDRFIFLDCVKTYEHKDKVGVNKILIGFCILNSSLFFYKYLTPNNTFIYHAYKFIDISFIMDFMIWHD